MGTAFYLRRGNQFQSWNCHKGKYDFAWRWLHQCFRQRRTFAFSLLRQRNCAEFSEAIRTGQSIF